jgi:hypothetical protein
MANLIVRGSLAVEKEILSQLGGPRFIVMTGASNLVGGNNTLAFKVGKNDKKVTHVRVTLEPSDTYKVEFLKIVGTKKPVNLYTAEDVYAEDLQRVFTNHTLLDTHL